jgi:hypothetical protein
MTYLKAFLQCRDVIVLTQAFPSKTQSSLQKHTSHLRQPESHDPSEVYSSVERAMSEVQDGKCPTREPQPTATGNMAFCIQ